jgi:D-glycero-alpha-D-manno-heptose-7-phosphate kinase
MIITRTPFRVSLFGGGSDYPAWFQQHGGCVLGFAINRYCYISVRRLPPFFDHKHRIVYSFIENVKEIAEIKHPVVRAVLTEMEIRDGLEIHHDGDLPARSGIGSSSSFTVGLLQALHALAGRHRGQRELADEAIHIEQDVIRENVGSQDQIWAAYGGFNHITFRCDGSYDVAPVILRPDRHRELQSHFMLLFSGLSHHASEIAVEQIANLNRHTRHIHRMMSLVNEAATVLGEPNRDILEIGELLHESWMLKRELAASISTPAIDEIYETARAAGAIGGKLLGAGGGGFVLLFVEPANRRSVRHALSRLIEVDFNIEDSGSRVVVYEPKGLEHV